MNYPDDYPLVLRSHELATIEDAATYLAASGEAKLVEKLQKILDRADVG